MIDCLPLLHAAQQQRKIPWEQPIATGLSPFELEHLTWQDWLDIPWWGPLDTILRDPTVHDIYINGPERPILIGQSGFIEPTHLILHAEWIHWLQRRLLALRIGPPAPHEQTEPCDPLSQLEAAPLFGGVSRMAHGFRRMRFALTTARRTPDGATITLRILPDTWPSLENLVAEEMLPAPVATLLRRALKAKATIIISGGTGSGKTTLTAALKQALGAQRSVVIQDAPELPTGGFVNDVGYLVDDGDTRGFLQCVRHALRQQPDRILIGEGRGPELLALIEGAATGHPGLTTIHAANAADALLRVETCASMAADTRPEIVRSNLSKLEILVVHLERIAGSRKVVEVAELRRGSSPRPGEPYEVGVAWTLRHGVLHHTADPIRAAWAQEVL